MLTRFWDWYEGLRDPARGMVEFFGLVFPAAFCTTFADNPVYIIFFVAYFGLVMCSRMLYEVHCVMVRKRMERWAEEGENGAGGGV